MGEKLCPGDVVRGSSGVYTIRRYIDIGSWSASYEAVDKRGVRVFLKAYGKPSPVSSWYDRYLNYEIELNNRLISDEMMSQQSVYALDVFSAHYEHRGELARHPMIYQVFPFIEKGMDLGKLIRKGYEGRPLAWRERLLAATVFAGAMERLHGLGIIHCDLKPENVGIECFKSAGGLSFVPKIIDMDVALLDGREAPWISDPAIGGYLGTHGYMSPEHCRGERPTFKSDAFTVSIILVRLLTEKHPYAASTGSCNRFAEAVLAGRTDFSLAEAPWYEGHALPVLGPLLFKALSPNQHERPTVAQLHAAAIEERRERVAHVGRSPVAPRPITPGPITPRPVTPVPKPVRPGLGPVPPAIAQPKVLRLSFSGPAGTWSTAMSDEVGGIQLRHAVGEASEYMHSNCQFRVERVGRDWFVMPSPMKVVNETWVNGKALTVRTRLASGDRISLGPKFAMMTVSFV